MLGSGAAIGNSRGSYGSLKGLPQLGSAGAFSSMHTPKPYWHAAAASLGLPGLKSSRRLVLGMCFFVMAGCMLSSLSVLRFSQPGSSSSWMMQREPTLKLMVASKLHKAQQAVSAMTTQQTPSVQRADRIPVQTQQPVLLQQQQEGTARVWGGASGSSSLQPASPQNSAATNNHRQQYPSKLWRRHTRPAVRHVKPQQQQQQQALAGTSAAAYDAASDVQIVPGQHELPLPQTLQEKLLKQQVTLAGSTGTAAAAAAGKAASGFLQALLLTGDESRPRDEPQQQQQQQQSSKDAAASPQHTQTQQPALTEAVVAAAMTSAAGTVHEGLDPVDTTSSYIMKRRVTPTRLQYPLWWHGPMWSGSGYGGGEACCCCCCCWVNLRVLQHCCVSNQSGVSHGTDGVDHLVLGGCKLLHDAITRVSALVKMFCCAQWAVAVPCCGRHVHAATVCCLLSLTACAEAINYVLSLVRSGRLAPADVWVRPPLLLCC
jgi:hypothetical protein